MEVRAVFELPVHIWVMCDALDATYSTGFGDLKFCVAMPQNRPPFGGPPAMLGIDSESELTGEQIVWAQEYAATIPDPLEPATALKRIAVTDVEGPAYEHKPWFTPDAQLAEFINRWFDHVRTWVEIFTGQDLDPNHRVYDAELVGDGLTFIEPPHNDAVGMILTTPRILPLLAHQWEAILILVRDGKDPPLEEVLSRDARAAHRRHTNRRAIIDAAAALEIVLGRHVRDVANQLPVKQRERISDRSALGDYISIADHSHLELAVPITQLRWVNRLRNDAVHRGGSPSDWDTGNAVQVMIDFLGAHGRIRHTEPSDGKEVGVGDMSHETARVRQQNAKT